MVDEATQEGARAPENAGRPGSRPSDAEAVDEALLRGAEGAFGGDAVDRLQRFAELLRGPGIERGLLGPREASRIWGRHLVNSAALVPLIGLAASDSASVAGGARTEPAANMGHTDGGLRSAGGVVESGARTAPAGVDSSRPAVIDIGSGAGLPGLVIACCAPTLEVTLVESMTRRVAWLRECAERLELGHVTVIDARAEDLFGELQAGSVVARAVAPLGKLLRLTWPLVAPGGQLLALKGARAADEVSAARKELRRAHARAEVLEVHAFTGAEPATVVRVRAS